VPEVQTSAVVVRDVLERNATEAPDEEFVRFDTGEVWTRHHAVEEMYAAGNALRALGVRQGDRVAAMLGNGADMLRAWWGAASIGAAIVPINTSYRGALLEHLLSLSDPKLVVVGEEFEEQLNSCETGRSSTHVGPAMLHTPDRNAPSLARPIESWDTHVLLLTSGTTGPSKLAELSYRATYVGGAWFTGSWDASSNDRLLVDLPMFHAAAIWFTTAAIAHRVRLAVRRAPDLNNYWDVVRETGSTMSVLVSSMVPYIESRPPQPSDHDHGLRVMAFAPLPADVATFQERFNIPTIITAYGSSEAPGSLTRRPGDPLVPGSCGTVRDHFEVRLVDEHDSEVPIGEIGEAIVRTDEPWMLMTGYYANPEATAEVMRNGWFHSGDLMRRDEAGNFFFIDRNKDSLRRRGENISSFDVESEICRFPGIQESACVAHREPGQVDDEVKVWVVPTADTEIDLDKLFLHCVAHMPHFMVPRYFQIAPSLPKTPTARIQKFKLREQGNDDTTWDSVAVGYKLTRAGLVETPK
jgi:crotonobetaine/carnitine-CoA ligase